MENRECAGGVAVDVFVVVGVVCLDIDAWLTRRGGDDTDSPRGVDEGVVIKGGGGGAAT